MLRGLTELTDLGLASTRIGDILPLSGLKQLRFLSLRDNRINDVSALKGMRRPTELHLEYSRIRDIRVLGALSELKTVYISASYLDLTLGSQAMSVVQSLLSRGVQVVYKPQKMAGALRARTAAEAAPTVNRALTGRQRRIDCMARNFFRDSFLRLSRMVEENHEQHRVHSGPADS